MKYKIKFWSELKKIGNKYKPKNHQIEITRENYNEIVRLFESGDEVTGIEVYLVK